MVMHGWRRPGSRPGRTAARVCGNPMQAGCRPASSPRPHRGSTRAHPPHPLGGTRGEALRRRHHRRRPQRPDDRRVPRSRRLVRAGPRAPPQGRRRHDDRGDRPRLPVQRAQLRREPPAARDHPRPRAAEARPGDPPARRDLHAAPGRLPLAARRPRLDHARDPPLVQERRGRVRGVRAPHGRDGALHQADPRDHPAGPDLPRPARLAARRLAPARLQPPPAGPAAGLRGPHDDERVRLPRPVVRDAASQGDDVRLGDHRHLPRREVAGDGVRPPPPLHGRDRRRLPRLGDPQGRDRRRRRRDRVGRPLVRRGDPHRRARRAGPHHRRPRDRRRPRVRRGDRRGDGRLRGGRPADLPPARRRATSCPPTSWTR